MYTAKKEKFSLINKSEIARELGYTTSWTIRLLNGKVTTNKATAILITKMINPTGRLEDYFDKKED